MNNSAISFDCVSTAKNNGEFISNMKETDVVQEPAAAVASISPRHSCPTKPAGDVVQEEGVKRRQMIARSHEREMEKEVPEPETVDFYKGIVGVLDHLLVDSTHESYYWPVPAVKKRGNTPPSKKKAVQ